ARAERVLPELRFDPETFLERFAPAHHRGLLVRPHRTLRERAEHLGDLRRARESFALRNDLVREADAMGFVRGDEPSGEDPIHRAPEPDDARKALRPAI